MWVFCKRCRELKMEHSWVKEVEWKRRKMRRNARSMKSDFVLRSPVEADSSEGGDISGAEMAEDENSSDIQLKEEEEEEDEYVDGDSRQCVSRSLTGEVWISSYKMEQNYAVPSAGRTKHGKGCWA